MKKSRAQKGFTLVEMLVASSLFALVGTLTLTIFITSTRARASFNTRELLYDDAQFIMSELQRDIANNAIDYEEYYNQLVLGGYYGTNFGYYATQFYYNPKDNQYGQTGKCDDTTTNCINLGQNPANQNALLADTANAFMAPVGEVKNKDDNFCDGFDPTQELKQNKRNYVCVKNLYLISPNADKKTFIITQPRAEGEKKNGWLMKKSEMIQSDITGIFTCAEAYNCSPTLSADIINNESNDTASAITIATPDLGKNFTDIIPGRLNILDIRFYITPIEDPHKAFSEDKQGIIEQPTITIYMQVQPTENLTTGKETPRLELIKKITPAIFEEIRSYPPRMKACEKSNCTKP